MDEKHCGLHKKPADLDLHCSKNHKLSAEWPNIGITHVFSCINICRVPRKLFEHEAVRPSVQTSPEGPGKC